MTSTVGGPNAAASTGSHHPHGGAAPPPSSADGGVGGGVSSGILYDMSSFDPLQAHALQLTASAGLTSLLQVPGQQLLPPPAATPTPAPQPHHYLQGFVAAAAGPGDANNNNSGSSGFGHAQQQQQQQHQQLAIQQQLQQQLQQLQQQQQQQIQQQQQQQQTIQGSMGGAPKQQQQQQQSNQPYLFIQPQHHQAPGSAFSVPAPSPFASVGGLQPIAPAGGLAAQGGPAAAPQQQQQPTLLFPAGTDPAALAASLVAHAGFSFAMPPGFPAAATSILMNAAAAAAAGAAAIPTAPVSSAGTGLPYQEAAPAGGHHHQVQQQHHHQQHQPQHQAPVYSSSLAPSTRNDGRGGSNHHRPGRDEQAGTGAGRKKRRLSPSVVSSSVASREYKARGRRMDAAAAAEAAEAAAAAAFAEDPVPPKEASQADLARMTPAERRRYDRNLREQQRSYRISQQIKELRDVLCDSNVPFKPNKYSILLSVVDYIKQLQSRAIMLDAEHQKLIATVRQTNDMVGSGNAPSSTDDSENTINAASVSESGSESDMLFVQGLDYRAIFEQCPAAMGIAALDGRILECNMEFQMLLGAQRDDLLRQSLFNLVRNHQDIFRAMAQMLKTAEEPTLMPSNGLVGSGGGGTAMMMSSDGLAADEDPASNDRFWTGPVTSKRDVKLLMNITMTLGDKGTPKFFSCTLTTTPS